MFIKEIKKKNKNSDKVYTYYRLVHSYKTGNKIRHQNIIGLGTLQGINKQHFKALANRIEELITGNSGLIFPPTSEFEQIEKTAQLYASKIIKDKLFTTQPKVVSLTKEVENNYQNIDLETIEEDESREIGGEWLIKQAFEQLGLDKILDSINLQKDLSDIAQMLLTAKLLHPSSELEAERWLKDNSAVKELYEYEKDVSRYKLYEAATVMYANKEEVEKQLYSKLQNIFSGKSKIVIFDLTNMHFTGRMEASEKADFGPSKQKQSGSKLIGLALSIDSMGCVRYSRFYEGNIGEPTTFKAMLIDVSKQLPSKAEDKPVVVMDAGIATEENLSIIKSKEFNYDYVCVSRRKPSSYTKEGDTEVINDNRGHKIELTKALVPGKNDYFLHIKSDEKQKKEQSIDNKLTKRFEEQLQEVKEKLGKKRTVKKIDKIHERIGRIKARSSKVSHLYEINYTEDSANNVVTDINWNRIDAKERPKGEYFLRYSKQDISESEVWNIYNMTRDVEAVFRTLKTDLDIRPIYHQKDEYIEPHIWLGIIAYQIVNFIRHRLKENNINYSWTTIVQKMMTMKSSLISVNNDKNEKLYIKLCTRPSKTQIDIFDSMGMQHRPFIRKTKLVPHM